MTISIYGEMCMIQGAMKLATETASHDLYQLELAATAHVVRRAEEEVADLTVECLEIAVRRCQDPWFGTFGL